MRTAVRYVCLLSTMAPCLTVRRTFLHSIIVFSFFELSTQDCTTKSSLTVYDCVWVCMCESLEMQVIPVRGSKSCLSCVCGETCHTSREPLSAQVTHQIHTPHKNAGWVEALVCSVITGYRCLFKASRLRGSISPLECMECVSVYFFIQFNSAN